MKKVSIELHELTRIIITLFIVTCSLLIVSCPDSIQNLDPALADLPAGKGVLRLSFDEDDSVSRNIVPQTKQENFLSYELTFTSTTPGNSQAPLNRTNENLNDPIALDEGSWSLTVKAYLDNPGTLLAAQGSGDFVIEEGGATTVFIELKAIFIGDINGTFKWDINFPAAVTAASMTITPKSEGSTETVRTFNFAGGGGDLTAKTGTVPLLPGYYSVLFNFDRGANYQTVEWREMLEIYQNLESSFTKNFDEDFFNSKIFTLTRVNYLGNSDDTISVTHGETVTVDWDPPNYTDHSFEGWYMDSSFNTPALSEIVINGDISLYAKWKEFPSLTITVATAQNITLTPIEVKDGSDNVIYTERKGTFTVTVSGFEPNAASNFGLSFSAASGLAFSGNTNSDPADENGVKSFAITVTYSGTTDLTTRPSVSISGLTAVPAGYKYTGGGVAINMIYVYSGSSTAGRQIPITKANIKHFNSYATDTATRTQALTKHYILTQNIDASDLPTPSENGTNWTAIGSGLSGSTTFSGTFEGGGYTITGLTIWNTGAAQYQGLFGSIVGTGSGVRNLGLIGVDIHSNGMYVGGITGNLDGGIIENCFVKGDISANNHYVGGIVGLINGGNDTLIVNCYTTGTVDASGSNYVGGIIGSHAFGTVSNCYSTSGIGGNRYTGGIAGEISNDAKLFSNIALNSSVISSSTFNDVGRVVGNVSGTDYIMRNNRAWSGMTVTTGNPVSAVVSGLNLKDGEDINAEQAKTQATWSGSAIGDEGADFWFKDKTPIAGTWDIWDGTKAPTLHGESNPWPSFTANTYTVTVIANPSTGGTITGGGSYATSATVSLSATANSGYTFKDWAVTGVGATVAGDASVSFSMPSRNVTVTANFTPNTYTVTYNANGGSGSAYTSSHIYDADKALTANSFTRTGYTFAGWSTTSGTQPVVYTNGETVKNLTATQNGNVNLYAQWTGNTYTVTFNSNASGGSGVVLSPTSKTVTYGSPYGELPTPTRAGFSFKGWFTSATNTTQRTASSTVSTSSNHTLYAQWTPYTVTFVVEGTTVATKTVQANGTIGAANMPADPADLEGVYACKFNGWSITTGGSGTFTGTTAVPGNITVTAQRRAFNLGETGPGGGKIYYRDSGGFTVEGVAIPAPFNAFGYDTYTAYYLEAAPGALGSGSSYRYLHTDVFAYTVVPTGTAIGRGRYNTATVIQQVGIANAGTYAQPFYLCLTGEINSKRDWFMPSRDELAKLYENRSYVSGFGQTYFSSSRTGQNAYALVSGVMQQAGMANGPVWPIRAF